MFLFMKKYLQDVEVKKTHLLLPIFAMCLITANIGTNLFAQRLVSFELLGFNFTVGGGIFIFPVSFFIMDTVTEYYGFKTATFLIFFNVFALALCTFFFWYTMQVSAINPDIVDNHYKYIINPFHRAFLATACSVLTAYLLNCYLIDRLKKYFNGKKMFFRLMLATTFAELLYSVVWVTVDMAGKVTLDQFSTIVGSNFLVKLVFQAASTPLTYLIVCYLRSIDENEIVVLDKKFDNI